MNSDYIRRITNQKREYTPCPFSSGGGGLSDFLFLANAFENLSDDELEPYFGLIDSMRQTHVECISCSAKILAFCEIFTCGRNLPQAREYTNEYETKYITNRFNRDYRAEVYDYIEEQKDASA
ncbi:MAG: hypothetical protein ACSHX9_00260 [Luteolibacter sp.]